MDLVGSLGKAVTAPSVMEKRKLEDHTTGPTTKRLKSTTEEKKEKKKKKKKKKNKNKNKNKTHTEETQLTLSSTTTASAVATTGIDDIFGTLQATKAKREKKRKKEAKRAERRARVEDEEFTKLRPRRDADTGLNVYTEDQLSILNGSSKNGGNTVHCPFDCNCCF